MAPAILTINSKNYGSWSLRGWLLCKMAGLDFEELITYDVKLDPACAAYRKAIMALPSMHEWIAGAKAEQEEVLELDVEF